MLKELLIQSVLFEGEIVYVNQREIKDLLLQQLLLFPQLFQFLHQPLKSIKEKFDNSFYSINR